MNILKVHIRNGKQALLYVFLLAVLLSACAPAAATPAVSQKLEASDPAAYLRSSGKVQLVEFFAFW